jgi:hypothetical protein
LQAAHLTSLEKYLQIARNAGKHTRKINQNTTQKKCWQAHSPHHSKEHSNEILARTLKTTLKANAGRHTQNNTQNIYWQAHSPQVHEVVVAGRASHNERDHPLGLRAGSQQQWRIKKRT